VFLGAYHFDGDTTELVAAYDRMMSNFPIDEIDIHICVRRPDGLDVYDACPSRAVFREFSSSDGFNAAIASAGLPQPRITELGEVHKSIASMSVVGD